MSSLHIIEHYPISLIMEWLRLKINKGNRSLSIPRIFVCYPGTPLLKLQKKLQWMVALLELMSLSQNLKKKLSFL